MAQKEEIYKNRQAIVEHPYGTIKRQWGFNHVMTKRKIECASADIGFIMTAYNLRRLFNILSFKKLCDFMMESILNCQIWTHKVVGCVRLKYQIIFSYHELILRLKPTNKFSNKLVVSF